MYTLGDLIEDYTDGNVYAQEILDSDGITICYVIAPNGGDLSMAEALLSHLNK